MLDTLVETLLQEIATEMAFLMPGSPQSLGPMVDALGRLQQTPAIAHLDEMQQILKHSLDQCQEILSVNQGFSQDQLDELQNAFEHMSNALYSAKPAEQPIAKQTPEPTEAHADDEEVEDGFFLKPDDDQELLNEFCNEGRDLLDHIEQGVLVLEENPKHKDTLNQVFRAFHTFKGGAGFLGIEPIKHLAHQLESVLDAARRDQLAIGREVIEVILAGGDALRQYVTAIEQRLKDQDHHQAVVVPTAALLARAQACLQGEIAAPSNPSPAENIAKPVAPRPAPATPSPQVSAPSSSEASREAPGVLPASPEPLAPADLRPVVASLTDAVVDKHKARLTHPVHSPAPQPAPTAKKASKSAPQEEALANYVKLDTRKLDALVDLMGELVIAQSMVVQHPLVKTHHDRELERHLRQLSRITTDLQHNAMSLRMVPIRSVFQKMTRLVRDLATAQHKQVQLHFSGEDTELDRNIVEELSDPLLHMIRNAVDHAIESPADRSVQGKPSEGSIHLQASHQGGGILIRVRDDGKGLDASKILAKAVQRGLVAPDNALAEKDIFNLIFLPGFSTAETVTDVSGRGVGMDVVRGSIGKLRGRIDIESQLGEGTTFNIFLPLTLAIIDGMLVGVGEERFILPTLTIRESLRPKPGMVYSIQGKGEVIQVRDRLIPLVRLSEKLGIASRAQDPCDGIVMVVDSGARLRALLVDRLLGKQEVVIKSLGDLFRHHPGMSGAAIMGDGRVALIIDQDAISQLPTITPQAA